MHFPADDYTPYGYLATPTHTRNLTPRGVLRSWDAGVCWHYPAYASGYGGRREIYRAGLRVGLDDALALAQFDAVSSAYHSANLLAFDLRRQRATAQVEVHAVGEHAVRARVTAADAAALVCEVVYTRLMAANGEWGESGLVGRLRADGLVLQGFEDGHAFVLWCSRPPRDIRIAADADDLAGAPLLRDPDAFVPALGRAGDLVTLHGRLVFDGSAPLELILARGLTRREAELQLRLARDGADAALAAGRAADDQFWATAPRLMGDWPDHWRRGLVYDFETLRMMVKPPVGIYGQIWDAMQIQAPRVVLGEAAIDALLLSYADPALAQQLLLGTFADAPEPQVPCSREDGSYNMVAADGSACGTAPPWGYPWLVLGWLARLRPDQAWLRAIYPHLQSYLEWWLAERTDAAGWLGYACSWESGQDDSPRFGAQPLGGGHPVRHVRPVDLHAAFAHAATVMADFAMQLGLPADAARWTAEADANRDRTLALWSGARFADFDATAGAFTAVDDVMLLAPLALGQAQKAQIAALRAAVEALDPADSVWPMFAWTAVEALQAADLDAQAAEFAAAICERAYSFWDMRPADPARTLPGVTCEYWPLSGRCGGEGYGWGAFGIHLVLHTLLGFTPDVAHVALRPNLPVAWRVPGRRYAVQLAWRGAVHTIALEPLSAERVAVTVDGERVEGAWGATLAYPWEAAA
jgi:hypothetical protein